MHCELQSNITRCGLAPSSCLCWTSTGQIIKTAATKPVCLAIDRLCLNVLRTTKPQTVVRVDAFFMLFWYHSKNCWRSVSSKGLWIPARFQAATGHAWEPARTTADAVVDLQEALNMARLIMVRRGSPSQARRVVWAAAAHFRLAVQGLCVGCWRMHRWSSYKHCLLSQPLEGFMIGHVARAKTFRGG